jgi:hypothetical protein
MRILALILALAAVNLRAELQFSGYFLTANESLFALNEKDGGESSGWLPMGGSFHSCTITSFDRATEVLTLEREGLVTRLHLRDSKVKDGRKTITGTISLWPGPQDRSFQASLFEEEDQVFPIREGVMLHMKANVQPDGTILYHPRVVTRDKDGKESSESWPWVVALPGGEFSERIGDIGFSFKP